MKSKWIVMVALCGTATLISGQDASRTITVNLHYAPLVPENTLFRAGDLATQIFERAGVPVEFRAGRNRRHQRPSATELEVSFEMEAPAEMSFRGLALSHPYRPDGRIVLSYLRLRDVCSRVRICDSREAQAMLLAYILTHEITHVLEESTAHSPTGVMKKSWSRADFGEISAGKLEFDPMDRELLRKGIERRADDGRQGSLQNVTASR